MGHSTSSEKSSPLVIDTSVVINLNSSGIGPRLLKALGRPVLISDVVAGELNGERSRARRDHEVLKGWIAAGYLKEVPLDGKCAEIFESLISGSAGDTLDDGEAATIAHALDVSGAAVIDERKANRICMERYPTLEVVSTVDLLLDPLAWAALGESTLSDALFAALTGARMRVPSRNMPRVLELLGQERASLCRCLPSAVRTTASGAD